MSIIRRLFCDHEYEFVRNIYGDEINAAGGKRSWWRCRKCGKMQLRGYLLDEVREQGGNMPNAEEISDGFHTMAELYHHRAVLFSVIVRDHADLAWKSRLHHDGTMYDGMFIVGIDTPSGQATYHYDIDPYWDMFECRELDRAPEWDGHTPDDAIARISTLRPRTCTPTSLCARDNAPYLQDSIVCSECGAYLCNEFGKVWQAYCPACGAKVRKQ